VINNGVWTDSWPSTTGVGCGLFCVVIGEEQVRKVLARMVSGDGDMRTMRGSRTGGWSLPCVMSD
jgi:hypothetical protein